MGRKLTVTLAIALLMFVLAPMASADLITTPDGILIIPDGSQVTAVFILPFFGGDQNVVGVDFQFQGGTGSTAGTFGEGNFTSITFTDPVTNLLLTAISPPGTGATLFADSDIVFQCGSLLNPCPGPFDLTLSGPISDLFLVNLTGGFSGIESMSFTVDAGDPRTSSLLLLGSGLLGLVTLFRRMVSVCP